MIVIVSDENQHDPPPDQIPNPAPPGPMIIYRMAKFKSAESTSATLAPQARQARASGKNLNYKTLAPRPSGTTR